MNESLKSDEEESKLAEESRKIDEESQKRNEESRKSNEVTIQYDESGVVKDYECPYCSSQVKLHHIDDVGTKWFLCVKCEQYSTKLKSGERTQLEKTLENLKDVEKPISLQEIADILDTTIKHDTANKRITFLSGLLTFTEEDQINIAYTAESSTGKSYIPLELAWYFPKKDVVEYGYVSPTAFFHEYGELIPDPADVREVEEEKKRKIIVIDLEQKILIFLDQPHDMLLQRLRPLLSHDRKSIIMKITDRKERSGLRTKTICINGYPTVFFCSSKFSMEDQERTRLLLLSPDTTQEKIKDGIRLKIEKEGDRHAFYNFMDSNPQRNWLKQRVAKIAEAKICFVIVPENLRSEIFQKFIEVHRSLIPRHQRDITRLLALIKAHALLNLWHREKVELSNSIIVSEEDVTEGFKLYEEVSESNELGLSPEVFEIYKRIEPRIPDEGITRKEFLRLYYETYHRTLGERRFKELLSILGTVGLITEEPDPDNRKQMLLLPTCRVSYIEKTKKGEKETQKTLSPEQTIHNTRHVGNAQKEPVGPILLSEEGSKRVESLPEIFRGSEPLPIKDILSKVKIEWTTGYESDFIELAMKLGELTREEARQLFNSQVEEGKILIDPQGYWRWI